MDWRATVLNPLAGNSKVTSEKDPSLEEVSDRTKSMFAFLRSSYLAHEKVTVARTMKDSDFVFFLGHVHLASKPLSSHLFLYHPESNALPSGTGGHEAETFLLDEKIIAECKLRQGAHVVMLACGSGVTQARVPDEASGPVPAFFHPAARSVVGSLWDITIDDAYQWIRAVEGAWKEREWMLRKSKSSLEMIDLGDCFQAAARSMLESVGRGNLVIDTGCFPEHHASLKTRSQRTIGLNMFTIAHH